MTGSFFSSTSCFWQPASSAKAVLARIEAAGKDKRLGVLADGGETDDVTFLLMAPPGRGPSRSLAEIRRIVDRGKKENRSRKGIAGLVKSGPIDPAMVPA